MTRKEKAAAIIAGAEALADSYPMLSYAGTQAVIFRNGVYGLSEDQQARLYDIVKG